jgi:hypothetical protein
MFFSLSAASDIESKQIKEDELGGTCSRHGADELCINDLVGKP